METPLSRFDPDFEWGISSDIGVYVCRNEKHALIMMSTTSPVLGSPSSRVIVRRPKGPWEPVESPSSH